MEQKDKGDVKWKYSTYCSALKKDIKLKFIENVHCCRQI